MNTLFYERSRDVTRARGCDQLHGCDNNKSPLFDDYSMIIKACMHVCINQTSRGRYTMAVEYLIGIILGRHQNVEYYTLTSIILQKYFGSASEVLLGTHIVFLSELSS